MQHSLTFYERHSHQTWYSLLTPISRYRAKLRQSLIKENCHNSRTSDDIDMKLWPVTKLGKRNKTTSKNWRWPHFGKLWRHCHFPIYNQFGEFRKPDSGRLVPRIYIFINSNFYLTKTEKNLKIIKHSSITLLLWVEVLFWPKNTDFLQKNADISKIKRTLVLKGIFSESTYVCVCT